MGSGTDSDSMRTWQTPPAPPRPDVSRSMVRSQETADPQNVPSRGPARGARDDRPHGNAAVGATYYPPPARSRASPKVGPPILSRPLRAIEGATSDPAPGRAGHGNAHSGTGRGSTPH